MTRPAPARAHVVASGSRTRKGLHIRAIGGQYYTPDQARQVLATFQQPPGFDADDFIAQLSLQAAGFVIRYHAEGMTETSLTVSGPKFHALARHLNAASLALDRLMSQDGLRRDLVSAAVVDAFGATGDLERVPAEQRIASARRSIAWLARVATEAGRSPFARQGRGKRPVAGRALFIDNALALLLKNAADVRALKAYKATGGTVRGNVVAYLDAALRPLGVPTTRAGLLKMIERSGVWRQRASIARPVATPPISPAGARTKG